MEGDLVRELFRLLDYEAELFEHAGFEEMKQFEDEDTGCLDAEKRHQVETLSNGEVNKTEVFISQAKGEDARQPSLTEKLPYRPDRRK